MSGEAGTIAETSARPRTGALGRGFWVAFAIGLSWSLYRALADRGWIIDDELTHYLISSEVWNDPRELLHVWSRPGRNLIHFVPAYFGLTGARLWTLALSAVAVWLTGREAQRLGMSRLWLLPLLVWFQWWFPELSYPVLTEAPFMLVWIAGIALAVRGRLVPAALCFGLLGLIRHEGIALAAMWGLWVVFDEDGVARLLVQRRLSDAWAAVPRSVWLGGWTLLPMALVNAAAWRLGRPMPIEVFFDSEPTDIYGSGPLWLYLRHVAIGAGLPVIALVVIGLVQLRRRLRWDLLLYATYPAYLVLHSVIYWQGLFASGGYYYFIMPMAPWLGLLALQGVGLLTDRLGSRVLWVIVPVVVWGGLLIPQEQRDPPGDQVGAIADAAPGWRVIAAPREAGTFGDALSDGADWVERNAAGAPWLAHHHAVWFYLENADVGPRLIPGLADDRPETHVAGTVLIWDAKYSDEIYGYSLARVDAADWTEIESYAFDTVRIFVKE